MDPLGGIVGQFLNTSAVLSVVVVLINYLRPLVERFVTPGSQAENNVLQLLNYALNFVGLYLLNVYQLGGQLPDAPQVVGIFTAALGGAVGSHIVYTKTKSAIQNRSRGAFAVAVAQPLVQSGISVGGVANFDPAPAAVPVPSLSPVPAQPVASEGA